MPEDADAPRGHLVESIGVDFLQVEEYLRAQGEVSFLNTVESAVPKILVLAGASHLEQEIQQSILEYYSRVTGRDKRALEFVKNKAVARQYHSYFDWERANANKFFALFGEDFKRDMAVKIKSDDDISSCMRSFLELGELRNRLVHQNYGVFSLEKTASEIISLYRRALRFVDWIHSCLHGE